MSAHSGKFGVVNGASTVRNWTLNDVSTPQRFVASNTKEGSGRVAGVRDWTGNYASYGGKPVVMPGEYFAWQGYTAPDDDISGNPGTVYSGTAIVESILVNWNWQTGEIINHVVNFGGHGALAADDATVAIADATFPDAPEICGRKLLYCPLAGCGSVGSQSDCNLEWPQIVSIALTISSDVVTSVNSSTDCWTERFAGPIDWTAAIVEEETQREGLPGIDVGLDVELCIFVKPTEHWHLKWGHVRDFSGITIDMETGAITSRTVNLDMNGFDQVGQAVGLITQPGEVTDWWPFA